MNNTVENLILDLVDRETLDAWRTSCPRLPVWEDATDRGFVETFSVDGQVRVRPTPVGLAFLREHRPQVHEELEDRSGR